MKIFRAPYFLIHLFLLLYLCLNTSAQKLEELPNTAVGSMAQSFFDAFNSDDREQMQEFIANRRTASALKRVSLENRMKMFDHQKEMIQAFDSVSIIVEDSLSLSLLSYSSTKDSWFKIGFKLDSESGLLESLLLRPSRAPKVKKTDPFGRWRNPQQLLRNIVASEKIPGISLVTISQGRIDRVAVAGVRRIGQKAPIRKNDKFHLGSITKSFTATLVGKLIEERQLNFESSLEEVFPEIPMLPAYQAVTIRQLLDHQGGIPAYLMVSDEEEAKLLALPGSPEEQRLAFVKLVLMQEANSKVGSFSYSNAGYTILASICEQKSGESWEQLLKKHIFDPLKMNTAASGWPDSKDANQPIGHYGPLKNAKPQGDDYYLGAYLDPAGDLHASMEDLAKFIIAYMKALKGKNSILKAETIQALHKLENGNFYAGGWMIRKTEAGQVLHEHSGSAGTFMAYAGMDPETENGWVIAANVGDLALDGLFKEIIAVVSKRK